MFAKGIDLSMVSSVQLLSNRGAVKRKHEQNLLPVDSFCVNSETNGAAGSHGHGGTPMRP